MADLTLAQIFAELFDYLADNPDSRARQFANKLAYMTLQYDFSTEQMGCDEALIKLDVGHFVIDKYGDEYIKLKCEK